MADWNPRENELFLKALDRPDADRATFLAGECGADADLRQAVDTLLAAHVAAGGFLADPHPDALATGAYGDENATRTHGDPDGTRTGGQHTAGDARDQGANAGALIDGKYTLVEAIGEGGMGSVWRAKQTEPVKRFVAVKLIKAGMDSKQVLARFEAERQALAMMDHPNIAKVLDGGLHEHRPFFVMELVKGVPITDYCDNGKLTPQQRLELFVQVCQAIQHAHQKGVIHRDIKPSNVLVALYDDRPVVKVIDFGVAKATGGALTEHTLDTGFGGVVGTPQYMSPEQATFNNLDIDTRSDVYALGVLLYELLAGSPPFSGAELKKKGLLEILRVVREEEPPRPSAKLSTADARPSISANRGTEPKKLTGLLRNELDWIVMKALEKDRTRRYETANGFAADVLRYLSGEAVQAHPPSRVYRLKKFVKRNKGPVIAASLVFAALVAGGTTTAWQWWQTAVQKRRTEEALLRVQAEDSYKRAALAESQLSRGRLLHLMETTMSRNRRLGRATATTNSMEDPVLRQLEEEVEDLWAELAEATEPFSNGALRDVETAYLNSRDNFQFLADAYPREPVYLDRLAECLERLGEVSTELRETEVAGHRLQVAVTIRTRLVSGFGSRSSVPDWQSKLGAVLDQLAVVRKQTGGNGVRLLLQDSAQHHHAALRSDATNPRYRARFSRNRELLASLMLESELDSPEQFASVVAEAGEYARDPMTVSVRDASYCVMYSIKLARNTTLPPLRRAVLMMWLEHEAMKHLRKAVQHGWRDAKYLTNSPDFAILRDLADFKKLVTELEKPAAPKK